MLQVIGAIVLALWLVGCGAIGSEPNSTLVKQAVAIQLSQTQQELGQQLRLNTQPAEIKIDRLTITQRIPFQISNLPSYRVLGNCNFTVKLPKRSVTQQNVPFEVYLQRQKEGKTWRLAFLKPNETSEPVWVTQRIPTQQYE